MQKKRSGGEVIMGSGKQIMGILGSMVKGKSMELRSKTREMKMRLTIFWLLKDKKVLLGPTHHLAPKLQTLLTGHHNSLPIESTAVIQEKEKKEEDEDAIARMMMKVMMSKQGIQLVQMHKNNNHKAMQTEHITTPTTKFSMPILEPTTTREEENYLDPNEEEFEEEKNDGDVVNVTVEDQPWKFDEDEVTFHDPYNYSSKDGELHQDEDYNDDDDDDDVKNNIMHKDEDYNDNDDDDVKDNINIDEAADLFIRNFRRQLRLQKNQNSCSS